MNPLWQYQPLFQDYAARLGYMLSLGAGATEVGLYFPVRDFWAAAPAKSTPESQANDDVALELEKRQVDFDFVDDDLLGSRRPCRTAPCMPARCPTTRSSFRRPA